MDDRFDDLARALARSPLPRRRFMTLTAAAVGAVAGGLALRGQPARAATEQCGAGGAGGSCTSPNGVCCSKPTADYCCPDNFKCDGGDVNKCVYR